MINDKKLEQANTTGSTGYQSGGAMTVYGISYTEARQIALDLWKANALELSQQAAQVASERIDKFLDAFLTRINTLNPSLFNKLNDPGIQWALFSAQRDYAKSGNESVFDLLIEVLIDRAEQDERNVLQIVLDESISVVSKLTEEHLDIITLLFVLKTASIPIEPNLEDFNQFLETYIRPFCNNLVLSSSCVKHLQYSNCVTLSSENRTQKKMQFVNLLKSIYPLFFMKGFTKDEFESQCGSIRHFPDKLFTSYIHDTSLTQFNFTNIDDFFELVRQIDNRHYDNITRTDDKAQIMLRYKGAKEMSSDEAKFFLEENRPFLQLINSVSDNYKFLFLHLTSVGIAIAQANLKRRTGISLSLSTWVN